MIPNTQAKVALTLIEEPYILRAIITVQGTIEGKATLIT